MIHLSKFMEGTTPRGKPNINYGLEGIMMYQCKFISCNKWISPVGDVDSGGSHVGPKSIWAIFVLSTQFLVNRKLLLKIMSIFQCPIRVFLTN